ncbi:MAG: NAD(P)H-hydrate dehydratase [Clostridiales bacterium]|nr:NAD(P)H-hydrate dehydratase [Clostridiales bacterium]
MKVVSRSQMRRIEQFAIDDVGLPGLLLMENASLRLLEHCMAYLAGKKNPKVLIAAGTGGNGGDGLALARHLHLKGVEIRIILVGDSSSVRGDSLINLEIVRKMGLSIEPIPIGESVFDVPYAIESCDMVVDALFGIGLERRVEGSFEYIIDMINTYAKYIISVDIPSGINADTGQVMGKAIKANMTVTLGYPKIGMVLYPGAAYTGKIEVADISLPPTLAADTNMRIYTDEEIPSLLPVRRQRSNKGSFGRIYAFTGSNAMPGAAVLSCAAAYKAGAGYVCACVVPSVASIIHQSVKEVVTHILPEKSGMLYKRSFDAISEGLKRADVIYVGPGLGVGEHVTEFVFALLEAANVPIVIDADGLNAVSTNVNILKKIQSPCIITPHPGEMSRLTGLTIQEILDNTINVAGEFAREFEVVTVLKDARSVCASPSGHNYINASGCSALAKAGSGDVLTGIIAGLLGQGLDTFTAANLAMYIHGKAGERAGEELSNYSVTATDLLEKIPAVLKRFESKP